MFSRPSLWNNNTKSDFWQYWYSLRQVLIFSDEINGHVTNATKINIVLVHGAGADASSWSKVIPILLNAGHKVIAVQLPLQYIENIVDDTILKTIRDLENKKVDNYEDLLYITKLSKNPEDYKGDIAAKTIGIQQNQRKGELIKYFKRNDGRPTIDPDEIGWEKYTSEYLNLFKKDLEAIGYDVTILEAACGR